MNIHYQEGVTDAALENFADKPRPDAFLRALEARGIRLAEEEGFDGEV
ncbi:hypothetical protein IV417_03360 [Alphaproteobacteria bacterium KMM 3653]|uniref:Uncharacterized protein n=1 Tax=Harenicola maris TaxID=2841044 RepID=A0AAP2G6N1_9RHOB|nr:hypothetical protein [Harenicola maris]